MNQLLVLLLLTLLCYGSISSFSISRPIARTVTVVLHSSKKGVPSSSSVYSKKKNTIVSSSSLVPVQSDNGIQFLPEAIGKPVGELLNLLSNLFVKQVGSTKQSTQDIKLELIETIAATSQNGIIASDVQRSDISSYVDVLEKLNPTKNPAYSDKMNGFWKLLYTDFLPAAPSSGKLGPFVGDVYQDLDSKNMVIKNILNITFPPIFGILYAKQSCKDSQTWQIEFDKVENKLFSIPIMSKKFTKREIREWRIVYLDDDFRVLRAKRPEADESFLFILTRADCASVPSY